MISQIKRKLTNQFISYVAIMIFQFLGTMLFAYTNLGLINLGHQTNSPVLQEIYTSIFYSLSLFMNLAIGRIFSGGLYNPSVVIYRMLRVKQRFTLKVGFSYLVTQFLGAILGSILAFWINDYKYSSINGPTPFSGTEQIKSIYNEAIGTYVLTTMVQFINQKKMTFIQHNRQFYICIPLFLLICRQFSNIGQGLNPATGFGFHLAYCIFQNQWPIFYQFYIVVVGPILGTFVGVLVFQFVYKPLYPLKKAQIQKQIQQIKKNEQERRRKSTILHRNSKLSRLISNNSINFKIQQIEQKIDYKKHKYTLNQINNLRKQEQVYMKQEEVIIKQQQQLTHIQSVMYHDQAQSLIDSDEQLQKNNKQKQMDIMSFKNYSFNHQQQEQNKNKNKNQNQNNSPQKLIQKKKPQNKRQKVFQSFKYGNN